MSSLWKMPQNKLSDEACVNDFQTPGHICDYMVSLLPDNVKTVLEPTPGLGNLVRALKDYDVTAPQDYWSLDKQKKYDAVVANLPFSSKTWTNCPPELDGKGMIVA